MLPAEAALVLMSWLGSGFDCHSRSFTWTWDYEQHTDVLALLFSKRLVSHHGMGLTLSHGTVTANIGVGKICSAREENHSR
jgi:hypothetical protein